MISVVIPAFNAETTIADQLGAIARQSDGVALEVIVADNGSSDATRTVVETWSERLPVRLVDASARRGPAAARNIGASSARGDLLIFTDADDVVMPGWLQAWDAAVGPAAVRIRTDRLVRPGFADPGQCARRLG